MSGRGHRFLERFVSGALAVYLLPFLAGLPGFHTCRPDCGLPHGGRNGEGAVHSATGDGDAHGAETAFCPVCQAGTMAKNAGFPPAIRLETPRIAGRAGPDPVLDARPGETLVCLLPRAPPSLVRV